MNNAGEIVAIHNFEQLEAAAKQQTPKRIVVAGADNAAAIDAVARAENQGITRPILIGASGKMQAHLDTLSPESAAAAIYVDDSDESIARTAVELIRSGEGDILLKGSIPTSALLKAVLDRERGIRSASLLSDSFLFEDTSRDGNQLIDITDGGVVLYPDVDQKQAILENAVQVYHALGHELPKVAICAAIETVNDKMPPTQDAAELKHRYESGAITGCIVDGPLALDGALSSESLKIKGIDSPLGGKADVLVMPTIEAANLVAKSTQYVAGKEAAHVIVGATVPVLIPSRSDTPRGKYLSIALAAVMST